MGCKVYCQSNYSDKRFINFSNILITSCKNIGKVEKVYMNFINLKNNKLSINKNSTLMYVLKQENSTDCVKSMVIDFLKFRHDMPRFRNIFIIGAIDQVFFNAIMSSIKTATCNDSSAITFYNSDSFNSNFADVLAIDAIDTLNIKH